MRWQEFESRYSQETYSRARGSCEEIHDNQRGFAGFFCNYCCQRDGWFCFPCQGIRELHEERWGESLDEIMSGQG